MGVDVFFVISGYLITALLAREIESSGSISFSAFYARRARRLLPASLLTLATILLAAVVLLPRMFWREIGADVASAALYASNWWFHSKALDYLAQGETPSPAQHFWSLSIEEQFYFIWPLVMLGAYKLAVARRWAQPRTALVVVLGAITVGSLIYSIAVALHGVPGSGYFSSFTRFWQLGTGGLLALGMGRLHRLQGSVALVLGLVAITASAFLLTAEVAYPGWLALVPTLGTALAIYAGEAFNRSAVTSWLGRSSVQYVGDISYSLYLWHWPIIAFYKRFNPEGFDFFGGLGAILLSLILAAASKRWIEDAFRKGHLSTISTRRILQVGAAASAMCAVIALGLRLGDGERQGDRLTVTGEPVVGALAIHNGRLSDATDAFVPRLVDVESDVADAYAQGCIQQIESADVLRCVYGNDNAAVKVAVIGDSHAVHWLPAFQELVRKYDAQVVGMTKTSCAFSDVPVYHSTLKHMYDSCVTWSRAVVDALKKSDIKYVVVAQSPHYYTSNGADPNASAEAIGSGMVRLWDELRASGKVVLPILPTPWQPTVVRECAALRKPPYEECTGPASKVLRRGPVTAAVRAGGYKPLDFTAFFCVGERCPAVIGGVFIYRDAHHLTTTYVRTLAPILVEKLGVDNLVARVDEFAPEAPPVLGDVTALRPALDAARFDRGEAFADKCLQNSGDTPTSCRYGGEKARVRIALVGDGTAANLLPALNNVSREKQWEVTTFLKDSCLFSAVPVHSKMSNSPFADCTAWSRHVLDALLKSRPDLVIVSQSPIYHVGPDVSLEGSRDRLASGVVEMWKPLIAAGVRVVRVEYTPWMRSDVPACLKSDVSRKQGCFGYRQGSMRVGALSAAASNLPEVATLDMTNLFCGKDYCPPVKDGVLIYRDASQPTATFMRSISADVATQLTSML